MHWNTDHQWTQIIVREQNDRALKIIIILRVITGGQDNRTAKSEHFVPILLANVIIDQHMGIKESRKSDNPSIIQRTITPSILWRVVSKNLLSSRDFLITLNWSKVYFSVSSSKAKKCSEKYVQELITIRSSHFPGSWIEVIVTNYKIPKQK